MHVEHRAAERLDEWVGAGLRMARLLAKAAQLFLLLALIGRFVERMGAVECGCSPQCWCKQRGLSLFRWVVPFGHRGGDYG